MGYPSIPFDPQAPTGSPLLQRVGMLQALLEGLFEAACIVDGASLRIIGVNPPLLQLFGRDAAWLLGEPVERIAHSPEDHHFWLSTQAELSMGLLPVDTRSRLHSDTLVTHADGTVLRVERRIVPIELPSGHAGWLVTLQDDAPRRQLQEELDRLSAAWNAAMDGTRDALLVTDRDGAVRGCSRSFLALLGLPENTPATAPHLVQHLQTLAADPTGCRQRWQAALDEARSTWTERLTLADGRVLEWHSMPQYARGALVGRLHAWRDLTPQLQAEARQQLAAEVFDSVRDAILVLDANHRVQHLNRSATLLCDTHACSGTPLTDWLRDPADPEHVTLALQSLIEQDRWEGELQLHSRHGTIPVTAMFQRTGASGHAGGHSLVVLRDLRERDAQQEALRQISRRDPLTGLANRLGFAEQVEAQLLKAPLQALAVLAVGIDRFTRINDSLGPDAGDAVLVETARRLQQALGDRGTLARLGGDTFVMLLPEAGAQAAETLARQAIQALADRFTAGQMNFSVQASIGIALAPTDGSNADELVKNADSALQDVKHRTAGQLRFYQPRMNMALLARMQMDHAMRTGLAAGHFELHFQPQFGLQDGTLIGAEALLRWRDPALGPIGPDQFIPVAEDTGFIVELGDFVVREAVRLIGRWLRAGSRVPIGINISALQFQQEHFADQVIALLQAEQVPGELVELELTESVLALDLQHIAAQLHQLAAHGVRLAIDDFGTGYSSLGYLKRLPLHRLKIDRSFVRGLPTDTSDAAIVRNIVQMAHDLRLRVIAEGVETEAQAQFLSQSGCHEVQGYLYARPMPAEAFTALLGSTAPAT